MVSEMLKTHTFRPSCSQKFSPVVIFVTLIPVICLH